MALLRYAKYWCPPSSGTAARANSCTSKTSIKCTGVHSQEVGPTPFSLCYPLGKSLLSILLNRATSSVGHLFFKCSTMHCKHSLSSWHPADRTFPTRKVSLPPLLEAPFFPCLPTPAAQAHSSPTVVSWSQSGAARTTICFHTWPCPWDTADQWLTLLVRIGMKALETVFHVLV